MTTKFGHLEGRLTLTIGGNPVDLGTVQVPLTGYYDRGRVQLQLDVDGVARTIRGLFKIAEPPAPEDDDQRVVLLNDSWTPITTTGTVIGDE